ncbi:MAG: hypothetical protein WAT51_13855 [Holophaga sp.]
MKKKILIPLFLFLIPAALGMWLLVRRGPVAGAPEDTPASFRVETFGGGLLYRHSDAQTPLRALRWLPPQADGIQALQVVTQNDRQRLVVFKEGKQITDLLIPRPAGVREGFFNFAELPEAIVLPDVAVLLYRSANPSAGELPLVVAHDLPSGMLRWVHRAAGEHLALAAATADPAVYLWGPTSPVLRLPLGLQKGERVGSTPFRATVAALDMPEEIKTVSAFASTGPGSFLLAHSAGLASLTNGKEWKHWPMPIQTQLHFSDNRSALAVSKGFWWQPFPGKLLQVKADGTPIGTEVNLQDPPDPWTKDRLLLKLRGTDPQGNLWFSLALPTMTSAVATPPSPSPVEASAEKSDPAPTTEPTSISEASRPLADTEEWSTYLALGLERAYRWHPERRLLQPINLTGLWNKMAFPMGVNRPSALPDFQPASGSVLVESGSSAWSLPLETLIKSGN